MASFVSGCGVGVGALPHTSARKCSRTQDFGTGRITTSPVRMTMNPSPSGGNDGATLSANSETITERKAALFSAIEGLDFGRAILNNAEAQESIEQLLKAVEAVNPTAAPAKSGLLDGKWVLAYSTSERTTGGTRPKVFQADLIFQHLTVQPGAKEGALQNQEEGSLLGPIRWKNVIFGECKQVSETRLRIKFNKFLIGGILPIQAPGNLIGWQEHTFLDEDTRVVRTNYGNVVVMRRES